MGNRTPQTRAIQRSSAVPTERDSFTRFLDSTTLLLSTALSPEANIEDVLDSALALASESAGSKPTVLCVRVADEWRARAIGIEGDGEAHPANIETALVHKTSADRKLHALSPAEAESLFGGDVAKRARVWQCLPLANGQQLLGAVYFGMPNERDLSDDRRVMLDAFSARVVAALGFRLQRDALERAVRARDQALSVVAHDLRNPLNVVAIAANTLLQRLSDTPARQPIERIIRSVQRADRMIRDLLEISAIETGRLSLEKHLIEPADVMLAALDSQQALAAEASVIIATDLSPDLPRIDADEERLHRVMENLIGNAIKFTGAGGQITVGATRQESELLVWVKDSGIGIQAEHMPHIFDRFWQASRAERHGTGLGLTICKGIVEAHSGRIWAESVPGEGTSMYFSLPAEHANAKKSPADRKANILIVDDRPENLVALEAILERPEYRLISATSGEEALSLSLREQFAVALIDVAMPGMNGLDVAVNLKALERSRDIPIIFITAFGNDPEEIHRAYTAGGADYLVKPLDAEIVRKKVAVFVELSRRRNGIERARARP